MDYKTGFHSMNGWFKERLSEPQLPLYAAISHDTEHPFSSIGFAQIKQGDMRFKSVVSENHLYAEKSVPGFMSVARIHNALAPSTWQALMTHFKQSLEKLADDFCNGSAVVDPLSISVCTTCDLKTVCRYQSL
jgi:ATP-dependent helicase/DNAse subunit B